MKSNKIIFLGKALRYYKENKLGMILSFKGQMSKNKH